MARILIMDDDEQVLAMLEQTLERKGYEVETAINGKEGLKRHRENPADLIITDLVMPEKEGMETIRELLKDSPDVKIIAISGGGRVDPMGYLGTAKLLGAQCVFAKPVDRKVLLDAIRELLK